MKIESSNLKEVTQRVLKNVSLLLGGTGISAVLGFSAMALNAHGIGASGVGVMALLHSAASLFIGLFSPGSQQPIILLGRKSIESRKLDQLGMISAFGILVDVAASIIAGISALIVLYIASHFSMIDPLSASYAEIYVVVVFFSATSSARGILRLFDQFHFIVLAQVLEAGTIFLLALALYILQADVSSYVIGYACVRVVASILLLALSIFSLNSHGVRLNFSPKGFRGTDIFTVYYSYLWTTTATGAIDAIRRQADTIILGWAFGSSSVGVYSVSKQAAGVLNKISSPLTSTVFPEISILAVKNKYSDARALMVKITLFSLVVGGIGTLGAMLIGKDALVLVFGEGFDEGHISLVLLMAASTVTLSSSAYGGYVQAFRSPSVLFMIYGSTVLVYCLAILPCIHFYGMAGAALSQLIFATLYWIACWKVIFTHLE